MFDVLLRSVGDSYGEMPLSGLWLASFDDPGYANVRARSGVWNGQSIAKKSV